MSVSLSKLCSQYKELTKIHFLSDLPLDYREGKTSIFRYMQYQDLKLSLNNRSFAFMTPDNWEDKLERRYWQIDYSAVNPNFEVPKFACLCVTPENQDDSAASWKMYRKDCKDKKLDDFDNNLVRLTIHFERFIGALNAWAEKEGSEIYIIAVDYSYGQQEIIDMAKSCDFFPRGFDIEDYFRVLSFKRPYYSFEREIRFFALEPKWGNAIEKNLLILKDFDISKCITRDSYDKKLTAELVRDEIKIFFADRENLSNIIKACRQFEGKKCDKITPKERKNMKLLSKETKYMVECSIREIGIDASTGNAKSLSVKIRGTSAFCNKDGSAVYNLFQKCNNGKIEMSTMRKIDADSFIKLECTEEIRKWILFAFEKEKNVVLELDINDEDGTNINPKVLAITVK